MGTCPGCDDNRYLVGGVEFVERGIVLNFPIPVPYFIDDHYQKIDQYHLPRYARSIAGLTNT
jgi:hypothetical protein